VLSPDQEKYIPLLSCFTKSAVAELLALLGDMCYQAPMTAVAPTPYGVTAIIRERKAVCLPLADRPPMAL
jgi:hypothetical protein